MVALARRTLRYEWRRFLPATVAVAFASFLLLLQASLVLGIFGSASVYVTGSSADVWVGYPGTQSVDQGRPVDPDVATLIDMEPGVARVEPFIWFDGDWRGTAATGPVSVFVSGIDTRADGLMFSKVLSPELRLALQMPDAVIVDRSELEKLGVAVGSSARINGETVRVVGVGSGLRALGGVSVLASLETARRLNVDAPHPDWPTYVVAQLRDPARADAVAEQLSRQPGGGPHQAWASDAFARQSTMFWLFDTGAGAGVLFLAGVVCLVGAAITSQTLVGAVFGSIREYATLNALGVGLGSLRWVVLEQAFWVGAVGLVAASISGLLVISLARLKDIPVVFNAGLWLACMGVVMALAVFSGLIALRSLRRADPAELLR
ncbi:MAG: FtsX-like permease family protein [Lysobacter sp.]|nr:MAG: FtsX-like permease family protein [Lysobacter sp.]